jgi:DNA invertase Pin-like site-specific DNA recombinase
MGCVLRSVQPAEDHALVHDEADPSRALVRRILASIHAYERDMIRLRLRNGAARKAERGGYTSGRPPYGWAAIGRELVPVPNEQTIRATIKSWRREGWSLQAIADKLNADGTPSQTGVRWSKVTVNSVAKNTRRATTSPPKRKAG